MGFRYFGVYETGVCFALLAVNSIFGWLDRTEVRLYRLLHRSAAPEPGRRLRNEKSDGRTHLRDPESLPTTTACS